MKLYMHPVATTARPVRLFCAESGIALDEEVVDLMTGAHHKEPYASLNPSRQVPLLVDGDLALPESQVIADYLDLALPGPKLIPADIVGATKVRLLVRLADSYVVPQLGGLFRGRENPAGVPDALKGMGEALGYIEHYRNADDAFVYGDSFSQADAALIPLFFFLDALD
jgi:glutathione S-transferase